MLAVTGNSMSRDPQPCCRPWQQCGAFLWL